MKTIVVGGGLQGLCSAQALLERGHEVQVFEALDGVGLDTSFANGGLITPSRSEPWNGPVAIMHLLRSVVEASPAFRLSPKAVPSLIPWGIDFLRHSTARRRLASLRANFELARFSKRKLAELRPRLGLEFCHSSSGTMNVYRAGEPVAPIREQSAYLAQFGLRYEELGPEQVIEIEPALEQAAELIEGAFFYPDDESGDAYLFCRALAAAIAVSGGSVRTGAPVARLLAERGTVAGVISEGERFEADAVVIAAGYQSPRLLKSAGLSLPIAPVKGYSITLDLAGASRMPRVPLIDETRHSAVTPLGDRLRVTSTVEFSGLDKRIDPRRVDDLFELFGELYPQLASRVDRGGVRPWAGLRPVSSDGRPFIGPTRQPGLYVNAGHGPLGFTLAAGSAELLACLVEGAAPGIDPRPFDPDR